MKMMNSAREAMLRADEQGSFRHAFPMEKPVETYRPRQFCVSFPQEWKENGKLQEFMGFSDEAGTN
jgi:hypothetical protein